LTDRRGARASTRNLDIAADVVHYRCLEQRCDGHPDSPAAIAARGEAMLRVNVLWPYGAFENDANGDFTELVHADASAAPDAAIRQGPMLSTRWRHATAHC
jgi:hypothetical protein